MVALWFKNLDEVQQRLNTKNTIHAFLFQFQWKLLWEPDNTPHVNATDDGEYLAGMLAQQQLEVN